jgi:hypothetical protein
MRMLRRPMQAAPALGLNVLLLAAGCLAVAPTAQAQGQFQGHGQASSRERVRPFTKVEGWRVATLMQNGRAAGCVAVSNFVDGTTLIIGYSDRWWLGLNNAAWQKFGTRSLPVQISVDARPVHQGTALQKDRLVVMEFGDTADKIASLMTGQTMTFVMALGRTSFSLRGSAKATAAIADCVKARGGQAVAGTTGSAQGNSQGGGAFGGAGLAEGGAGNKNAALGAQRKVAPRAQTLELATTYLAKLGTPYTVLDPTANLLRNFPVNWTFPDGGFGGMVIYTGANANAQKFFDEFVADNARLCKGSSALQRQAPFLNGEKQITRYSAVGTCQETERAYLTDFTVLAGPELVVAIVNIGKIGGEGTPPRQEQSRKWSL